VSSAAHEPAPRRAADPWLLAFECSGTVWSAALACGERVVATHLGLNAREASEQLVCVVRDMLNAHAILPTQLAAVGVGTGPGSFTGTRVALATAFGMRAGLPHLTLVGVDAFAVERARCAQAPSQADALAVTAIFSPPDDVYLAVTQGAECIQSFACRVDAVASRMAGLHEHALTLQQPMVLVGSAWALPALAAAGASASVMKPLTAPPPAAVTIAHLAFRVTHGEYCGGLQVCAPDQLNALLPTYVGEPRINVPTPRSFAPRPVTPTVTDRK
jgi:tRNA threonylcarbamoyladenosine biosynthesis protein TsaB